MVDRRENVSIFFFFFNHHRLRQGRARRPCYQVVVRVQGEICEMSPRLHCSPPKLEKTDGPLHLCVCVLMCVCEIKIYILKKKRIWRFPYL